MDSLAPTGIEPMATRPKYPNQQLRSVSIETYFPGRLRALAALAEVQDAVGDSLTNLYVPHVQGGEAVALRPYQLRDDGQRRSLALSVNQATFISFQYPGFDAFCSEAVPILSRVLGIVRPPHLNRVVFRYENEVGVSRMPDGIAPVARIFPGVLAPLCAGTGPNGACTTLDSAQEARWRDGQEQGVRGFHARLEENHGSDVLRVSVYSAVETEKRSLGDLMRCVEAAHTTAAAVFEQIISEDFRAFISAEPTEDADAGSS